MMKIGDLLPSPGWVKMDDGKPGNTGQLCQPDCPECGGQGYVRYEVPLGHPKFGKLFPCSKMDLDVNLPALSHLYGLSKSERNLDWNNLLPLEGSNARVAEKVVRKVLDRGYGWVYLWGEYGTAKSLILQIATSVSLQTGKEASYVRMAEILDHIRAGFNEGNASKRLDWWEAVPVLCVDEFERVHETDWAGEKRFVLMDNRYVSACRRESVTIIAGNADPSKLDGYLWDRINDGRFEIVKMTGESARPGMDWADKS